MSLGLAALAVAGSADRRASCAEGAEPVASTGKYSEREVFFYRDGLKIYGKEFLPEGVEGKIPTAIIAHGFGANLTRCEPYARALAENGFAAYVFDFVGGGRQIKSDGKMTEMSVLTEAADLYVVLDGIAKRDEVDPANVFLSGESQGGFVASYVAASRPDDVRGLIALYPAYVLQDDAKKRTPDPNAIPETTNVMGMTIGRIYTSDALSFDIYDMLPNYERNVLIIHGTADPIVPVAYAERAARVFPSAELVKIDGAGHGFHGADLTRAAGLVVKFVRENVAKP